MPAAAATDRITQRAVPLISGVAPNAAVRASRSMTSPDRAAALPTEIVSPETVAAGLTASEMSFTDSNICALTCRSSSDRPAMLTALTPAASATSRRNDHVGPLRNTRRRDLAHTAQRLATETPGHKERHPG